MSNEYKIFWWITAGLGTTLLLTYMNKKRVMKNLESDQLTRNFNLSEFVVTSTGLDNIPGEEDKRNLKLLAENILQPLRDYLQKPIVITSGYRSSLVNAAIGGSATSQHSKGQAADFHVVGMTNQQIIDAIRFLRLPFDQLIDENLKGKQWVHVSYNPLGGRRQLMTARDGATGGTVYKTIS